MSYEGYSQFLCKNGHYWTRDCYDDDRICPKCSDLAVWENMVNTTNGSFEGNLRIDGFIELTIAEITECKTCGTVLETIYKIPKKGRIK